MSRCVIVSACPVSPELKRLLRPDDLIIACDAGYRNCAPLGCKPDIIVGDFDTAPCPEQQDDVIVLPHVKDDTDTEYAAKLASEKGCSEVLLLGGLTGLFMILVAPPAAVFLSLLPFHFRERSWYRRILFWYYAVINSLLIVAVNLADCVYFRYTQKRFTADEIFFADNSNSVQLVLKFAAENWYLLLVGAVLIWLLVWGYGRKITPRSPLREGWVYHSVNTGLLVIAILLGIAGMRGGVTRMTRPITLSNATLYASTSEKANLILSNPFCILRTIGSGGSVKYTRYFSPEKLDEYFTPTHRPDSSAVNLEGRNVMVFILESMSAEHSAYLKPELYGNGTQPGYTPFLDSLMRQSLCFGQMYANGTRSIQAMPAVLGSIPSFKQPFVLMPQSLGKSRQLPQILRDKGYRTAFFCGSERGSMGFGAYARSASIERLLSREDYEAVHGTGDFDGYWGIWDEPFLQFTGEELSKMQEPFFATLFTLSSHHPFVVPEKYAATLPEGYTRIHKGVAYDDRAFRLFFQRFGGEEWFRRTIFVFVADHVSSEKFAEETRSYPGNMHLIGFIYTPDGALRGEVGEITQQLDIMPTLLGLTGNRKPYFAFGRDVLNEPQRPRWSVSYDGRFRALTGEGAIVLDDSDMDVQECPATPAADSLAQNFRALVQQYYTHIEKKSYTAND